MTRPSLPTRTLRDKPDLEQLKRQAKELLRAFTDGDSAAVAEVNGHYHGADPTTFALHDAQLVIARAYGFESWPKLKAYVEGMTVRRLVNAVRAGNLEEVRAMLKVRPELARGSVDNLQVVHHAVLARAPEMVRILMANGANARGGVYPYRDATTAHAIAVQRGYDEIVRIIEEEEQRRPSGKSGMGPDPTPLHRAAHAHDLAATRRLLDDGADPNVRMHHDLTPLDVAAMRWHQLDTRQFEDVAKLLLARGARMTPPAAAALGDADWLRARHAEGQLQDVNDGAGGLLRIAVTYNHPEILALLLDLGFDPDERIRLSEADDAPFSWGMALQAAVGSQRYDLAEMLLKRGADPNAQIYASGDPVWSAYERGDDRMIALLERYGGIPHAGTVGACGSADLARRVLAGEAPCRLEGDAGTIGEQLLAEAARRGDPAIVRVALEHVDWARDDPAWFSLLEQTLRHDSDASLRDWGQSAHVVCFRLLLDRCDPNLRGRPTDDQQFGLTTLHNIVARGNLAPEERVAFANAILDRGARLDIRDNLLKSTPLGWACRWGHVPLVKLFLERGADPVENDADSWARPRAWAERMNRPDVLALLQR